MHSHNEKLLKHLQTMLLILRQVMLTLHSGAYVRQE